MKKESDLIEITDEYATHISKEEKAIWDILSSYGGINEMLIPNMGREIIEYVNKLSELKKEADTSDVNLPIKRVINTCETCVYNDKPDHEMPCIECYNGHDHKERDL